MQRQIYCLETCGFLQQLNIKFPLFGLSINKRFNKREIQFDRKAG